MLKVFKFLSITLAYGLASAWTLGFGMAYGLSHAFERTALACHLGRTAVHDGPDIIMLIGALAGAVMVLATGVDTFRTGAAPKIGDVGWLLRVVIFWFFGTCALLFCLIPFWIGCSLWRAIF
jgi:hypothetical protein